MYICSTSSVYTYTTYAVRGKCHRRPHPAATSRPCGASSADAPPPESFSMWPTLTQARARAVIPPFLRASVSVYTYQTCIKTVSVKGSIAKPLSSEIKKNVIFTLRCDYITPTSLVYMCTCQVHMYTSDAQAALSLCLEP